MPKQDNTKAQASQYDKIIKENLEITLPVIIRDVLGLDIAASEELPDDVQHTKERKPDALKKVTDTSGMTYVLQVWLNTILCLCAVINSLSSNMLFF
jgi:hypothetical protein